MRQPAVSGSSWRRLWRGVALATCRVQATVITSGERTREGVDYRKYRGCIHKQTSRCIFTVLLPASPTEVSMELQLKSLLQRTQSNPLVYTRRVNIGCVRVNRGRERAADERRSFNGAQTQASGPPKVRYRTVRPTVKGADRIIHCTHTHAKNTHVATLVHAPFINSGALTHIKHLQYLPRAPHMNLTLPPTTAVQSVACPSAAWWRMPREWAQEPPLLKTAWRRSRVCARGAQEPESRPSCSDQRAAERAAEHCLLGLSRLILPGAVEEPRALGSARAGAATCLPVRRQV